MPEERRNCEERSSPPARGQWLKDRFESLYGDIHSLLSIKPENFSLSNKIPPKKDCTTTVGQSGESGEVDFKSEYLNLLKNSEEFEAPDVENVLARGLGVEERLDGMKGSSFLGMESKGEKLAEFRQGFLKRMDWAWSNEALKAGVALAKTGNSESAISSYNRAIELNPQNTDAYVARGAAHANAGYFQLALFDLNNALELNERDENALRYKTAVEAKLRELKRKEKGGGGDEKLEYKGGYLEKNNDGEDAQKEGISKEDVQKALEVVRGFSKDKKRKRKHKNKHKSKSKSTKKDRKHHHHDRQRIKSDTKRSIVKKTSAKKSKYESSSTLDDSGDSRDCEKDSDYCNEDVDSRFGGPDMLNYSKMGHFNEFNDPKKGENDRNGARSGSRDRGRSRFARSDLKSRSRSVSRSRS